MHVGIADGQSALVSHRTNSAAVHAEAHAVCTACSAGPIPATVSQHLSPDAQLRGPPHRISVIVQVVSQAKPVVPAIPVVRQHFFPPLQSSGPSHALRTAPPVQAPLEQVYDAFVGGSAVAATKQHVAPTSQDV